MVNQLKVVNQNNYLATPDELKPFVVHLFGKIDSRMNAMGMGSAPPHIAAMFQEALFQSLMEVNLGV